MRCTISSRRSAVSSLLVNMMLGEVVFGGVGAGFYGMLMFVLLTVFIAGLMVGRTPEYLGKKIEAREDQMGRDRRARAGRGHSCAAARRRCFIRPR